MAIKLKCMYGGGLRVVMIDETTTMESLLRRLSADYGFDLKLQYQDAEGEFITLETRNDLEVMKMLHQETVKVYVEKIEPRSNCSLLPGRYTNILRPNPLRSNLLTPIARSHPRVSVIPSPCGPDSSSSDTVRSPSVDSQHPFSWHKGELLGAGAAGSVFIGFSNTCLLMAVKQVDIGDFDKEILDGLEREIMMLKHFNHPHIIRYYGYELLPPIFNIFLEYAPGGSIKNFLKKYGLMEEYTIEIYTKQILSGLEYLHRNGVAHRDIKGANILVSHDGSVKLSDFGSSKRMRLEKSIKSQVQGTPNWMAPEVIKDECCNKGWFKADVWSLGCTIVEMGTGVPPWSQFTTPMSAMYNIASTDAIPAFPAFSDLGKDFLSKCLSRDPNLRPSVTSLLLHPWVTKVRLNGDGFLPPIDDQHRPTTSEISRSNISSNSQDILWDGNFGAIPEGASREESREPIGRDSQPQILKTIDNPMPMDDSFHESLQDSFRDSFRDDLGDLDVPTTPLQQKSISHQPFSPVVCLDQSYDYDRPTPQLRVSSQQRPQPLTASSPSQSLYRKPHFRCLSDSNRAGGVPLASLAPESTPPASSQNPSAAVSPHLKIPPLKQTSRERLESQGSAKPKNRTVNTPKTPIIEESVLSVTGCSVGDSLVRSSTQDAPRKGRTATPETKPRAQSGKIRSKMFHRSPIRNKSLFSTDGSLTQEIACLIIQSVFRGYLSRAQTNLDRSSRRILTSEHIHYFHSQGVYSLHWLYASSTQPSILSTSSDGGACLFHGITGTLYERYPCDSEITGVALNEPSKRVYFGHVDGFVRVWDLPRSTILHNLKHSASPIRAVFVDALSSPLSILVGSQDGSIGCWDTRQKKPSIKLMQSSHDSITGICCFENTVIAGSKDSVVSLFDMRTGKPTLVIRSHRESILGVDRDVNNRKLISYSKDDLIKIWSLNGHCDKTLKTASPVPLTSVGLSSYGLIPTHGEELYLGAGHSDGSVRIWHSIKGNYKPFKTLLGVSAGISSMCIPSSSLCIAGTTSGTIHIWNVQLNEILWNLYCFPSKVTAILYHPEQRVVVAGGADGSIRFWNVPNL